VTFTAVVLALAIGLAMGVLGGGGSIIAVPAFTFLLHLPAKDAVVTSLAVVGLAATVGAVSGLLRGVVPIAVALTVGLSATLGAYAGAMVGARISDHVQLAILAAVMFVAAIALWREQGGTVTRGSHASKGLLAGLGLSIGALTGLVGVGGGFLIVPALAIGAGLPMQQAAAASLLVIALAAFAGLAGYLGHATPAWGFIVPFAAIAAAGTLAGAAIALRLPQRRLQQAFAVSLFVLGSYVLVQL
jgi:uncharacterized membrane protein YfcA